MFHLAACVMRFMSIQPRSGVFQCCLDALNRHWYCEECTDFMCGQETLQLCERCPIKLLNGKTGNGGLASMLKDADLNIPVISTSSSLK